jgi:hypothetical protein
MQMLSRLSVLLVAGTVAALAADPLMGTWKVIPESVKQPGDGPTDIVMKYEPAGESMVKFTLSAQIGGRPYTYSWTAKPGAGKSAPDGQISSQQVELQRPGQNHIITIHYRGGQEVARHDSTISPDGKVMTTKSRSQTRGGEIINSESQYRKQ